ncbi:uncharacterized protein LOC117795961 isoform X3 [Ailuropoda melanoleuca]|uniref:uncharacterized protein LOC117795961 isoform X3 n=1 Tax=Ailuropoda melanoleuca TaxID=9646 RepID=UPI0014940198|nr:uncharacterized protein LOC117795961 isoform X3 [Ailuropoda melanoleuca]
MQGDGNLHSHHIDTSAIHAAPRPGALPWHSEEDPKQRTGEDSHRHQCALECSLAPTSQSICCLIQDKTKAPHPLIGTEPQLFSQCSGLCPASVASHTLSSLPGMSEAALICSPLHPSQLIAVPVTLWGFSCDFRFLSGRHIHQPTTDGGTLSVTDDLGQILKGQHFKKLVTFQGPFISCTLRTWKPRTSEREEGKVTSCVTRMGKVPPSEHLAWEGPL